MGVFCGLIESELHLSARVVVAHRVLEGALSHRLLCRGAVEAWLWVGLGLKQGTQSFGAGRLLLREKVHGATPVQTGTLSRSPQDNVLLALLLLHATVHKAF